MAFQVIGKTDKDADAIVVLTVFEPEAVAVADRVEDRRECFLHVLRAALIDLRSGDRDKHGWEGSRRRTISRDGTSEVDPKRWTRKRVE